MATQRPSRTLRTLVVLGVGIKLFDSLTHGPGRGMSAIPLGETGLGHLSVATYAMMLLGALCFPNKPRCAVGLLALGVAGRAVLELKTSVARAWLDSGHGFDLVWGILIVLMYAATFALPFLLLLEAIRLLRNPRTINQTQDASLPPET